MNSIQGPPRPSIKRTALHWSGGKSFGSPQTDHAFTIVCPYLSLQLQSTKRFWLVHSQTAPGRGCRNGFTHGEPPFLDTLPHIIVLLQIESFFVAVLQALRYLPALAVGRTEVALAEVLPPLVHIAICRSPAVRCTIVCPLTALLTQSGRDECNEVSSPNVARALSLTSDHILQSVVTGCGSW